MVASLSVSLNPKSSSQVGQQPNQKRPPFLPSDAANGVAGHRRSKSREVTSRYMSSSTSTTSTSVTTSSSNSSSSRRFPSPQVPRTVPVTPVPASPAIKRSQSVERRRAVTPRPSTPDYGREMSSAAKLLVTSTRRLSVSFQGESFSLPVSKVKPAPAPSNLSLRKGTPERRKPATPGRDQTENLKPVDQHRWPGRSRQVNSLTRSMDYSAEKKILGGSGSSVKAFQQSTIYESSKASSDSKLRVQSVNDSLEKPVQPPVDVASAAGSDITPDPVASDNESVSSETTSCLKQECGNVAQARNRTRGIAVPARFWQETNCRLQRLPEPVSPESKISEVNTLFTPKLIAMKKPLTSSLTSSPRGVPASSRGFTSPLRSAVRPASPSRLMTPSMSSPSRGMISPSRVRNAVASTLNNCSSNIPSILSFSADIKRGKMGGSRIVDAHVLRLLYNRHLQWRFINARSDASLLVQSVTAEKSLYNAWVTTSKLRHFVRAKRMELQLLKQNLKLYSILNAQIPYLDDWDSINWDHINSLSGAIAALEACTLRLPVVGGARGDIRNLSDAICSAVEVMQTMASSLPSMLSKVEQVNNLGSELANVTKNERAMLEECKDTLSTLTTMQVNDCSLRTHILQLKNLPSRLMMTQV